MRASRTLFIILIISVPLLFFQNCGRFEIGQSGLASLGGFFFSRFGDKVSDVSPDATALGAFQVESGEYKLPASIDKDILDNGSMTEIWAKVYAPKDQKNSPLVIFLHGNHGTCGIQRNGYREDSSIEYSKTGTCPSGYVVTPNHLGYEYLANKLASHGFVVLSINANRGISGIRPGIAGDQGLVLTRGRLVLKHIQKLVQWSKSDEVKSQVGFSLVDRINFQQIGMMGHSRGGEGVRAAYNLYLDSDNYWKNRISKQIQFFGIFEIAPVDGMSDRVLNAEGIHWAVLIPSCDGDVSDYQGLRPFDRMMSKNGRILDGQKVPFRGIATVQGANHNFYNTEWQESDSTGCTNSKALFSTTEHTSETQKATGEALLISFFRSFAGKDADERFLFNLNPAFVPAEKVATLTKINRDFMFGSAFDGQMVSLEDFSLGFPNGLRGGFHQGQGIIVSNEAPANHDSLRRSIRIKWNGGNSRMLLSFERGGVSLKNTGTLDISLARPASTLNSGSVVELRLRIFDQQGKAFQWVSLTDYIKLSEPIGGPLGPQPIFQTVRIPLVNFGANPGTMLTGIEFEFNPNSSGDLYVGAVRLSPAPIPTFKQAKNLSIQSFETVTRSAPPQPSYKGMVKVRRMASASVPQLTVASADKEVIALESDIPLPITNSLPHLVLDGKIYKDCDFGPDNDSHTVFCQVPRNINLDSLNKAKDPLTSQNVQWANGLRMGSKIYSLGQ